MCEGEKPTPSPKNGLVVMCMVDPTDEESTTEVVDAIKHQIANDAKGIKVFKASFIERVEPDEETCERVVRRFRTNEESKTKAISDAEVHITSLSGTVEAEVGEESCEGVIADVLKVADMGGDGKLSDNEFLHAFDSELLPRRRRQGESSRVKEKLEDTLRSCGCKQLWANWYKG